MEGYFPDEENALQAELDYELDDVLFEPEWDDVIAWSG